MNSPVNEIFKSLTSLQKELNEQNLKQRNLEKVKQFLLEKKGVISEDFKSQEQNYINQGNDPQIVKTYIERFRKIRDKNYKQLNDQIGGLENVRDRKNIDSYKTFKELETIVDYVGGQIDLAGTSLGKDIEIDAKPIYEDNIFQIYYADSPKACIKYKGNIPYGWCVSRSDSTNMYYTYRYKEIEPTFYFVKVKDRTKKELGFFNMVGNVFNGQFKDKYHFFVIQVIKGAKIGDTTTKQYVVTSAMNDGDIRMSWDEIVAIEPRIAKLQEIFKPVELSPEDKEFYNKFKNGTDDKTFCKLDYTNKRRYLDIYVMPPKKLLTTYQFKCLPEDLKNLYIGFGVGLKESQLELIISNKNLLKRYQQITERKLQEFLKNKKELITFNYTEFLILPKDKKRDLIINLNPYIIKILLEDSDEPDKTIDEFFDIGGKEFVMNLNTHTHENIKNLLENSSEPKKFIHKFFDIGGKEFVMNLSRYSITHLILYSKEFEKIINILNKYENNKGTNFVINTSDSIEYFLLNLPSKKDEIINTLFNIGGKEFVMKLDSDGIYDLLKYSKEPDEMINTLFNIGGKEFVMNLKRNSITTLLKNSKEPEKLINTLNKYVPNIGTDYIINFSPNFIEGLINSLEPNKVINTLLNIGGKEFVMKLNANNIHYLLNYLREPEKCEKFIIKLFNIGGEQFIMNLNSTSIFNLLYFSKKSEKIKEILQKYGKLPKELTEITTPMNEIFKSLTSLQEELTEQRKQTIKETNLMKVQNFIKKRKSLLKENYNPNIIDEVFSETPELNQIGTKEDYNNYLNSVFNGESDLFYRGDVDGLEKFRYSESSSNKNRHKFGSGIYFTKNKPYAISYANDIPNGKLYKCLVDTSNKIEFNKQLDFISYVNKYLNMGNTIPSGVEIDIFTKEQQKKGKDIYIKNYNGHDELVVGDTNKILILGSNKDKEMFKNYMNNNQ